MSYYILSSNFKLLRFNIIIKLDYFDKRRNRNKEKSIIHKMVNRNIYVSKFK